jgi:hypothetical protein
MEQFSASRKVVFRPYRVGTFDEGSRPPILVNILSEGQRKSYSSVEEATGAAQPGDAIMALVPAAAVGDSSFFGPGLRPQAVAALPYGDHRDEGLKWDLKEIAKNSRIPVVRLEDLGTFDGLAL